MRFRRFLHFADSHTKRVSRTAKVKVREVPSVVIAGGRMNTDIREIRKM